MVRRREERCLAAPLSTRGRPHLAVVNTNEANCKTNSIVGATKPSCAPHSCTKRHHLFFMGWIAARVPGGVSRSAAFRDAAASQPKSRPSSSPARSQRATRRSRSCARLPVHAIPRRAHPPLESPDPSRHVGTANATTVDIDQVLERSIRVERPLSQN